MNKFWEEKTLKQLNDEEWESLCDGCGKCCLHKLEDEDTGDIYFTSVACKLLDLKTCRCTNYKNRGQFVPDCISLKKMDFEQFEWLPQSCAYRLLYENQPLPNWHPLIIGHENAVETISEIAISESDVEDMDDLEDFIIETDL